MYVYKWGNRGQYSKLEVTDKAWALFLIEVGMSLKHAGLPGKELRSRYFGFKLWRNSIYLSARFTATDLLVQCAVDSDLIIIQKMPYEIKDVWTRRQEYLF